MINKGLGDADSWSASEVTLSYAGIQTGGTLTIEYGSELSESETMSPVFAPYRI